MKQNPCCNKASWLIIVLKEAKKVNLKDIDNFKFILLTYIFQKMNWHYLASLPTKGEVKYKPQDAAPL